MEDDEKAIIIELVNHLGGKYTAKMSRSNTHLIVDRAFGQKWANAEAFGVKAVTTDWLVDSAKAGKLSSCTTPCLDSPVQAMAIPESLNHMPTVM